MVLLYVGYIRSLNTEIFVPGISKEFGSSGAACMLETQVLSDTSLLAA